MIIYHIISQNDWQQALEAGVYRPNSLTTEGFIHFSLLEQVLSTANRFYAGQAELRLLAVDEGAVSAEIKHEDLYNHGQLFPHLYGELLPKQVRAVHNLVIDTAGQFQIEMTTP